MNPPNLFTLGYQRWKVSARIAGMVNVLRENGVSCLVDIRHSPCASNPTPGGMYGPSEINLQPEGKGLVSHLAGNGIEYRWLVELGNPQKNDPKMKVLREHLSQSNKPWPVQRGLVLLENLIRSTEGYVALLCACKKYDECHRALIAEALLPKISGLTITDLSS
jgi:uncharacterized protein DUF488